MLHPPAVRKRGLFLWQKLSYVLMIAAGHQRRGSQGTPVGPQAGPTAFSSAAYAPAFGSAGMAFPMPHLYANSSGPLSPQLSQVCYQATCPTMLAMPEMFCLFVY